ncbi:hypothetical protein STEG23_029657 [Scotinomys teguina]
MSRRKQAKPRSVKGDGTNWIVIVCYAVELKPEPCIQGLAHASPSSYILNILPRRDSAWFRGRFRGDQVEGMLGKFSRFGCLTGLYSECPVLFTGSEYEFSTFSRGNVKACPGFPELISHLEVPVEISAVVPETTPHLFVSQTRGEKFPDKGVSLEDEGGLF